MYATVARIPRGRVATYGLVALVAGYPGAARAVGNAMRVCRDTAIPAHRVIRADGTLAFPRFRVRLEREGIAFRGPNVEIASALWTPRLSDAATRGADRARRAARRR